MPKTQQNSGNGSKSSLVIEKATPLFLARFLAREKDLRSQYAIGSAALYSLSLSFSLSACFLLYSLPFVLDLSVLLAFHFLIFALIFSLFFCQYLCCAILFSSGFLFLQFPELSDRHVLHQQASPSRLFESFWNMVSGRSSPLCEQDLRVHRFICSSFVAVSSFVEFPISTLLKSSVLICKSYQNTILTSTI